MTAILSRPIPQIQAAQESTEPSAFPSDDVHAVVQHGPAAPWFGQSGGGIQSYCPAPGDLVSTGYLRRIG
ncbi:glycohydrolase toxin TNT-related protein [Microbacterium aurantiacum]|uniref:glycohydrolase toxin TNT-related protein n=1 Tax=Microbacterium aurantiacum TaxID=162393 RepID=UPI0012E25BC0